MNGNSVTFYFAAFRS